MKAKNKTSKTQQSHGICNWKGCHMKGEYPAPKSRNNSNDKYHFCLDHIRIYNKSWDYFKGMSSKEIESFQVDSITGHRKTIRRGKYYKNYKEEDLVSEIFREFNFRDDVKEQKAPSGDIKYLRVLGLNYPVTMKQVKDRYKLLAKKYHPDIVGDGNEEKFKELSEAYQYFKNSGIE